MQTANYFVLTSHKITHINFIAKIILSITNIHHTFFSMNRTEYIVEEFAISQIEQSIRRVIQKSKFTRLIK